MDLAGCHVLPFKVGSLEGCERKRIVRNITNGRSKEMIKKTILSIILIFILLGAWVFIAIPGEQERRESSPQIMMQSMQSMATSPTPAELAEDLAEAIVNDLTASSCLIDVSFAGAVSQGAVFTRSGTPLQGFPTANGSFAVLSSGTAANAPGVATTFESTIMGGVGPGAGDPLGSPTYDSFDAVTLTLTFKLPATPGDLSFDWKFGTEENPTFLGSIYQDYFRADVGISPAFSNIAQFPGPLPVTVDNANAFANSPGGSSTVPTAPFPTPDDVVYNSVTTTIATATQDLSAYAGQTITLALRVADASDGTLDSAAFIDNLKIEGCETALPTPLSKFDTLETTCGPCTVERILDSKGCTTEILKRTQACDDCAGEVKDFIVNIDGNEDTTAISCEGSGRFGDSTRFCWPNGFGGMTCISF
jgi:hypothetical protein